MDDFEDLILATQSDLTIGDESSFLGLTTVKLALNRAYKKIAGLYRWEGTGDAKTTGTEAGLEYYEYPPEWRDNSVRRLEVDGEQWGEEPDGSPMTFEDYQIWRANPDNEGSTEKVWSNFDRKYFIYPVPTTTTVGNISIWGQEVVEELVANGDRTIFSRSMPEVNEAIVMEARAILKQKADVKISGDTMLSPDALQLATVAWTKAKQDKATKEDKDQPMWDVPDFFGRNNARSTDRRGQF